jgi:DnaJ-class molecular chaperone
MTMRDPYDVLGVPRGASAKDIKSAFRKLAKQYHPDQNPDNPKAQERFSEANQAYEIVGDEKKRAAFDRGEIDATGKPKFAGFEGAGGAGGPFGGFARGGPGASHFEFRSSRGGPVDEDDIFSHIFGQAFGQGASARSAGAGARRPQKGADVAGTLDVTLEEVAQAAKVEARMPEGRRIAVKLPAFVEDGQVIRLKGQGEQSPFGEPGDAMVTIRFRPHPRFRLEGRDLHADLPVKLEDAVLGAKLPVETLAGKVSLTIPAWSSSDRKMRIKGRGLPTKGGGHGDLYVTVRIMLPEGDSELEELMRKRRGD